MADPIRKLNGTGLSAFEQYLRDFREGEKLAPPFHLLTDSPVLGASGGLFVCGKEGIWDAL